MTTRVIGVSMAPGTGQLELEFDADLHDTGQNEQFYAGESEIHRTRGPASVQVRLVLDDLVGQSKVLWLAFLADRPHIVRIGLAANEDLNIIGLIRRVVPVINALREVTFQPSLDAEGMLAEHARLIEETTWTQAVEAIQVRLGDELQDAFNMAVANR